VNITKLKFSKWRPAVFVDVTDKEIREVKINSVPKTQNTYVKILKQLFASGSVIIGEYSPRLRLGPIRPVLPGNLHICLMCLGMGVDKELKGCLND
jgi:hypothetical protein